MIEYGAGLKFPYSSGIAGSKLGHLRELRIQHEGRPYRVFTPLIRYGQPISSAAKLELRAVFRDRTINLEGLIAERQRR